MNSETKRPKPKPSQQIVYSESKARVKVNNSDADRIRRLALEKYAEQQARWNEKEWWD